MGGGGGSAPQATVKVPTAADEEAAEKRARLYSMLRSRRGAKSLAYGARRTSILAPPWKDPNAAKPGDLSLFANPFTEPGGGSGGLGDTGAPDGSDSGGRAESI